MPEEYLGQQWCKPSHTWGSNDKLFSEAISIASNQGPLILCNVYRTNYGLRVIPINSEKLNTQTEDLKH